MPEQKKESAKQRFIAIIEQQILSGELAVDQKLPPERELAEKTGVSRVTVHAALLEMATKNVLRIIPRQGTYVNNFKKEGTLELYGALLQYTGEFDRDLLESLTEYREIIETTAAQKAAVFRTSDDVAQMRMLLAKERKAQNPEDAAALDYQMHLLIAKASGNIMLPMTLRSIEAMYISLVLRFYELLEDRSVVRDFHSQLISSIDQGEGEKARSIMKTMLDHGRQVLTSKRQKR